MKPDFWNKIGKQIETEALAETITLDSEAVELLLEYQKNPASLHLRSEVAKKILQLFMEKSA